MLDLTRVVSGPFCTMQLADLGAEVIKVERPGGGDDSRAFGPPFQGGQSAYFLSVNRSKRGIALDLKRPAGRDLLWELIGVSDVLVENFRPGAMDRLGLGYAAVRAARPSIVYASISGFGGDGPQAGRPGYDVIVQGEAGLMDLTGQPEGPPQKVGTSIADLASGLVAAQGILAALYARRGTGEGQHVTVSMYEAVASLLTFNAGIHFATGVSPRRRGNAHATIVPYETFEAADGWINLGVANDDLWRRFCAATGAGEIVDDPRFARAADRVRNRETLVPLVQAIIKRRSRDDWQARLEAAGVPCGAIRSVGEVCDGDLLRERGMIAEVAHPGTGTVRTIKSPVGLSATPLDVYGPAPRLGEHTDVVLSELLGRGAEAIATLRADGIVG